MDPLVHVPGGEFYDATVISPKKGNAGFAAKMKPGLLVDESRSGSAAPGVRATACGGTRTIRESHG